ncbi:hypothetical protein HDV00_010453 [Rhizophlyctis rosea]|nr:hypothetical protein HDV00_010453 [Rhizophlyctis rosea]
MDAATIASLLSSYAQEKFRLETELERVRDQLSKANWTIAQLQQQLKQIADIVEVGRSIGGHWHEWVDRSQSFPASEPSVAGRRSVERGAKSRGEQQRRYHDSLFQREDDASSFRSPDPLGRATGDDHEEEEELFARARSLIESERAKSVSLGPHSMTENPMVEDTGSHVGTSRKRARRSMAIEDRRSPHVVKVQNPRSTSAAPPSAVVGNHRDGADDASLHGGESQDVDHVDLSESSRGKQRPSPPATPHTAPTVNVQDTDPGDVFVDGGADADPGWELIQAKDSDEDPDGDEDDNGHHDRIAHSDVRKMGRDAVKQLIMKTPRGKLIVFVLNMQKATVDKPMKLNDISAALSRYLNVDFSASQIRKAASAYMLKMGELSLMIRVNKGSYALKSEYVGDQLYTRRRFKLLKLLSERLAEIGQASSAVVANQAVGDGGVGSSRPAITPAPTPQESLWLQELLNVNKATGKHVTTDPKRAMSSTNQSSLPASTLLALVQAAAPQYAVQGSTPSASSAVQSPSTQKRKGDDDSEISSSQKRPRLSSQPHSHLYRRHKEIRTTKGKRIITPAEFESELAYFHTISSDEPYIRVDGYPHKVTMSQVAIIDILDTLCYRNGRANARGVEVELLKQNRLYNPVEICWDEVYISEPIFLMLDEPGPEEGGEEQRWRRRWETSVAGALDGMVKQGFVDCRVESGQKVYELSNVISSVPMPVERFSPVKLGWRGPEL